MTLLIILGTIFVIFILLLQSLLLHGLTKVFKIKKSNYKTALLITGAATIASVVTILITNLIDVGILTVLLSFIIPFSTFYLLAKRYYKLKIVKTIAIYISLVVLSAILFGMITIFTETFLVKPYILSGNSMAPTLQDSEYMLFKKYDKSYERNEIIAFTSGNKSTPTIISRIIGLPEEKIQIKDNLVWINGEKFETQETPGETEITLGKNEYFVLSDNRANNNGDSRTYGSIRAESITGTYLTSYRRSK